MRNNCGRVKSFRLMAVRTDERSRLLLNIYTVQVVASEEGDMRMIKPPTFCTLE